MDKPSLRNAIDGMCKQCLYDERAKGGWRQQIEACTMPTCNLYNLRPLPRKRTTKGQSLRESIDAECKTCIYDPCDDGTWREQVERCGSGHCALHDVRPLPLSKRKLSQDWDETTNVLISDKNPSLIVPSTLVPKSHKSSVNVRFTGKKRGKLPLSNRVLDSTNLSSGVAGTEVKNDI